MLEQQDFLSALASLSPSLSREELAHYDVLRRKFAEKGKGVGTAGSVAASAVSSGGVKSMNGLYGEEVKFAEPVMKGLDASNEEEEKEVKQVNIPEQAAAPAPLAAGNHNTYQPNNHQQNSQRGWNRSRRGNRKH